MTAPLLLASSSPFRRMLMENAGLTFSCESASIDERAIEATLGDASPDTVALSLAKAKALDVAARNPQALVIGSDQTMSLGERVYHKSSSRDEAKENLLSLSGKTHRLNSAIAFARGNEIVWEHVSHAELSVRPLTEEFVDRYLTRVGEKVF